MFFVNQDKNYSRGKISLDPTKFTQSCVLFLSQSSKSHRTESDFSFAVPTLEKNPLEIKASHQQSINEIAVSLGAGGARSIFFCDGGNNC
jgi:hypothetical protein